MTKTVPQKLIEFIREGEKFIVAGHKEPDGDCVGCQIALASVLRRMDKKVVLCSAGPFKRVEIKQYEHMFKTALDRDEISGARVIIVDCSGIDRTGDIKPFLEGLPAVVIDHHEKGAWPCKTDTVFFVDEQAPSATLLVLKLIEALGLEPAREEAEVLFLGLCTDTGFFRHIDQKGADAFLAAGRLVAAGADPKNTFAVINGGKSLNSRKLLARILARAETYFGGKLIVSTEEYEDSKRYGLEGRDSENLYRLLLTVADVEAVVVIRQETPERCTVGLRSGDNVDVGSVASFFGGGGHKNAAGFATSGTINELKPKIIESFGNLFS